MSRARSALAALILAGACASAPAPAAKVPLASSDGQIEALREEYLKKIRASMAIEQGTPVASGSGIEAATTLPASTTVVATQPPVENSLPLPLSDPARSAAIAVQTPLVPIGPPPPAKDRPDAPLPNAPAELEARTPPVPVQASPVIAPEKAVVVPAKAPDEPELRRDLVRVLEARLAAGDTDPDLKRRLALEYLALDRPLEARQTMDGLGRQDLVSMFTRAAGLVHLGELDEALPIVAELHRRLESEATLALGELAFCRRVRGYGDLEKMRPAFKPNDRGLLYVPVLHYACREKGGLWRVALDIGLAIRDANGLTVWERPQQHRVDYETQAYQPTFYLPVPLRLPAYLPAGAYTMRVSVRDLQKDQEVSGDLEFKIE